MQKFVFLMLVSLLLISFMSSPYCATIIVKQDGSGDATTIQAAFNTASDGDVIEIGDDNTYIEDVTVSPFLAAVGIPAAPLASFTLQAAEGMHPVIQAANAESSQRMSIVGVPGRDMLGFSIWGCQHVVVKGLEIINLENVVNEFGIQSSLVIADCDDVVVEDCTFRGPNERSSGEGNAIIIAGVQANPFRVDNITIRNCLITESHYGIISAMFQKGSGVDPINVTIEDCQFINGFESGVDVDNAENMIIRNCLFDNYHHGIHFAGGKSLVEDCIIKNAKGEGLECQIDTNWTDAITSVTVRRCAIIGNGFESEDAPGVECTDGPLLFENCIIAGNAGPGVKVATDSNSPVNAVFDHCDIYENFGLSEIMIISGGDQSAKLTVTNSNIVSAGGGFENELEPSAVIAHHNNVAVSFDAYYNVDATDCIANDPLYESPTNNPDDFSWDGFKLKSGSPSLNTGEDGSTIGSTGSSVTFINAWEIF